MNDLNNIDELIKGSQKIRLLYVEDNLQARESTIILLKEFFADIIVAVNGEDGLAQFKESNAIDLVITDINMPKMTGLEMVKHIREINNDIPVLIFSAYNDPGIFIESIKLGVDGYLLKPFDIAQFTNLLDKIVQKIALQTKAQESDNILQQYKDITDKSAMISIIDTNETITYVNEAFCELSEYTKDELIGLKYKQIVSISQSKEIQDEIWSTLIDKKQIWQGVTKYISKSGRLYYLKNTIKPILDTHGNILEYIALRDDITEIHLAAQEKEKFLILEKEQANKANQAKSEFLSSMSHELRTPMNAILGFAQLLQYDENITDEQHDNLKEILNAGQHLLDLINDVLDLAKIESGQIKLSLEAVKLSSLVDECFTLIAPMAKKQAITLHHDDMNGYVVYADKVRLKQILLNLLSNAIKYNNEQGSINLELSFVNNNEIRITIIDTGNGIAEDRFEELFQPFNRLDAEAGNIEGTGIGLAITRNLIEIMGGRIGVDSQLNIGSQFWLELPMETSSLIDKQLNTETLVQNNSVIVKKQVHTILYIDDNPVNLKLVSNILARQAHLNLITSHEPALCLELAEIHHPKLIFLDIHMPDINGYQLLSTLHSDERFKAIPIVAVTASAMTKDIERGKAAGFNDYVTKPINIAQFLKIIEKHLVDA